MVSKIGKVCGSVCIPNEALYVSSKPRNNNSSLEKLILKKANKGDGVTITNPTLNTGNPSSPKEGSFWTSINDFLKQLRRKVSTTVCECESGGGSN